MILVVIITVVNVNSFGQEVAVETEDAREPAWSGDVTVGLYSKYLSPCNGVPYSDRPVFQTTTTLSHRSGFYGLIFYSTGLDSNFNEVGKYDDEIDLGIGYEYDFGKGWSVDVGVTYFNEADLGKLSGEDIWFLNATLSKSILGDGTSYTNLPSVSTFMSVCSYIPNPNSGTDGNEVIDFGLRIEPSIGIVSIPVTFAIAYDTGGFGIDAGFVARACAAVNWQISERFSIMAPLVTAYQPIDRDDIEDEIAFGGSITWTF